MDKDLSHSFHTLGAGPVYLNKDRERDTVSGDTSRRIDAEVTKMLREAYSRVTDLLVGHSLFAYLQAS